MSSLCCSAKKNIIGFAILSDGSGYFLDPTQRQPASTVLSVAAYVGRKLSGAHIG